MTENLESEIKAPISTNKFKLVFLGDQSVGKTSIINRFVFDTYEGKDHPTVGVDFISKNLIIDNKPIRLQLWDTAGQERFRTLIPGYIRDSQVGIIVFDVTNSMSLSNVPKWYEDVKNVRGNEALVVLVGNKIDVNERAVSTEEGEQKAKEINALYCEVSAKLGTNIQNLFSMIAGHLTGHESDALIQTIGKPSKRIQA